MWPTPPADGPTLQIVVQPVTNFVISGTRGDSRFCVLSTRIIEQLFIVSATQNLRVLTKSWSCFLGIGPPQVLLVLTKLSIQLFWSIGPPPGVAEQKSCIRHRRRMGPPFSCSYTQE
jgi:hypothetical protein